MARKTQWYDLRPANALRVYVENNFSLYATDKKVFRALQSLESQQDGFCKDVVANHRTIKRAAKVALNTVRASLKRMQSNGLIEYTAGSITYADRKASRIRRKSIAELEEERRQKQPAYQLAAILDKRPIVYGNETVRPKHRVAVTNRIYAREPNTQSKKKIRPKLLAEGCKDGEVLLELDFSAAEPSVISQKLGHSKDGYRIIAEAEGFDRAEVKGFFNEVVYARSTALAKAKRHGIKSVEGLAFIAEVDELRKELRRPEGKPVREITTATGTVIEAPKGKAFSGTMLSYYAQGTIADFINRAALNIIALEKERGWRLANTCHDALYVIAKPEQAIELEEIIMVETEQTKLKMKLATTPHHKQVTQGSIKKVVHRRKTAA